MVVPDMGSWLYTDSAVPESCIGDRLAEYSPPLNLIPIDRIRLEFFPWLEPAVAPKSQEAMRQWLRDEVVQTQLRALGIRYFLEFRGGTRMDTEGGMLCSYGCLDFIWGHRQSSFQRLLARHAEKRDVDRRDGRAAWSSHCARVSAAGSTHRGNENCRMSGTCREDPRRHRRHPSLARHGPSATQRFSSELGDQLARQPEVCAWRSQWPERFAPGAFRTTHQRIPGLRPERILIASSGTAESHAR